MRFFFLTIWTSCAALTIGLMLIGGMIYIGQDESPKMRVIYCHNTFQKYWQETGLPVEMGEEKFQECLKKGVR